jgi:hypothetical protein
MCRNGGGEAASTIERPMNRETVVLGLGLG